MDKTSKELKLYTLLGVKLFQNIIMKLEQHKHRKDKDRNANYHLEHGSLSALGNYECFIRYNAGIHLLSLALAAVYFAVTVITGKRCFFIDLFVAAAIVVNFYCIILQRYNYLRIKTFQQQYETIRHTKIRRRAAQMQIPDEREYSRDEKEKDYTFLFGLKTAIEGRENFVICAEDIDCLRRLTAIMHVNQTEHSAKSKRKTETDDTERSLQEETIGELAEHMNDRWFARQKSERRIAAYGKLIKGRDTEKHRAAAIIIPDTEADALFRQLFPHTNTDAILERTESMMIALEKGKNRIRACK